MQVVCAAAVAAPVMNVSHTIVSAMQASPDDIDLGTLWRAVVRNRARLGALTAATGVVTYLVVSLMTPLYLSQAEVIIEPDQSAYTRPRGQESRPSDGVKVDEAEVASQVEVVRSRDLLRRVADDLQLAKNPEFNGALAKRGLLGAIGSLLGLTGNGRMSEEERVIATLEERTRIYQIAKTRLIAIETLSADPQLAADIANGIAQAYIEGNRTSGLRQASDATEWIGGNIEEVRKAAEDAQAALEKYRAESGLLPGSNNLTLASQQIAELNSQLTQARTQRSETATRAKLIREMLKDGVIDAAPDVLNSSNMQQLFQQQLRIEREIAERSATDLEAHPRMRQLRSALRSVKQRIQEEGAKVVRSLESEAKVAAARESALAESLKQLTDQQAASSAAQARLSVLERESESKRGVYESLLDRLNDASTRTTRLAVPALASLNSKAVPSSVPASPKKLPITILTMVGALLAGLVAVITRELFVGARSGGVRRGRRAGDAPAERLAAPVAPPAAFEMPKPAVMARPVEAPKPAEAALPATASAAHGVVSLSRIADLAVFMETHGRAGSGVRTVMTSGPSVADVTDDAIVLARMLAGRDLRAVIVDWSAGTPGVAGRLGLKPAPGCVDLVNGTATFEQVIQADPRSPVHVIAGGDLSALPADGSGNAQLALVLDAFDAIYRHVIVCGQPDAVRDFLERAEGRVDMGVTIDLPGQGGAASTEFLGYDVSGMTRINLERAPKAKRVGVRVDTLPEVALRA